MHNNYTKHRAQTCSIYLTDDYLVAILDGLGEDAILISDTIAIGWQANGSH